MFCRLCLWFVVALVVAAFLLSAGGRESWKNQCDRLLPGQSSLMVMIDIHLKKTIAMTITVILTITRIANSSQYKQRRRRRRRRR